MAVNTFKCNSLAPLYFKGLMFYSYKMAKHAFLTTPGLLVTLTSLVNLRI